MTLKIETFASGDRTTIRLIGRIQAEHLPDLKAEIDDRSSNVVLDVEEVSLVDVEAVRFLGHCQMQGIVLVHASPYIADWIAKERDRSE